MVKIVATVHLAAHAKSCTLYGRRYGHKSKFLRLDGLLLFFYNYAATLRELRYKYGSYPTTKNIYSLISLKTE